MTKRYNPSDVINEMYEKYCHGFNYQEKKGEGMKRPHNVKVGDKFRVIKDGQIVTYSFGACDTHGYFHFPLDPEGIRNRGLSWSDLEPLNKTLRDMQVGDIVINDEGDELEVLEVLTQSCLLSDDLYHEEAGLWNTFKELEDDDWRLKDQPEDLIEMTLEEVAELKGVSVSKLRIKENV